MPSFSSLINRFAIVKQLPIFSKLNWFEIKRVALNSTVVEFQKGDIIYRQGQPPDALYCLVSGRLQAYTVNPEGEKENLEFIHRGKHFGIISLLTGEKHSLNFVAINDSVVLKIAYDEFHSILKDMPHLGLEFSHSLSRRVRRNVVRPKSIFESTIISTYSSRKGVGTSTYAINLALNLKKETGKKVLFVNISPKTDSPHSIADIEGEASPYWKEPGVDLEKIANNYEEIIASILKEEMAIDLLNVVFDPENVSLREEISHFISALTDDYHYIVVDLPNEMNDIVLKTLVQSDLVQLITSTDDQDLQFTKQVVERLKGDLKKDFKEEKFEIFISGRQDQYNPSHQKVSQRIGFEVAGRLPHINQGHLKSAVVSKALTVITPESQSEYAKAIKRIARRIGGVRVGLVLGGGAALGLAHIGVIRALEKEDISIDIVAGSSMGALIGSLWVQGRNAAAIETLAKQFSKQSNLWKLLDLVFPISGFIGGRAIKIWLKKQLGNTTFHEADIPLKVVSYDLVRREELVIDKGYIVDAVRKSISIPGIIEPIKEGAKVIIDGGVLNPLPTNVLTGLGIKKIIAVNVLQSPSDVCISHDLYEKNLKEQLSIPFMKAPVLYVQIRIKEKLRSIFSPNISDIMVRSLLATEYELSEQSGQQADIVIHPDSAGIQWYELYRVKELIQKGEEATIAVLPEIRKLVEDV